ncbi:MAG: molybdopterin biosynthesis protein, partial [Deltaproteobacteria bacterium]|nr:molybdopterin biosynthesis protein [Deltaproteobacteria bacterium]
MKSSRNIYLKMKTLVEAREILDREFNLAGILSEETIAVPEAVGRVLSSPVTAVLSSPNFHSAAMDGIAVKAETTFDASETNPKELIVGSSAFYINTGHVIPEDCDAVIMIEQVNVLDEKRVVIEAPAFPWQHVRKMGEDIVATELLFPQNHMITPYCVGALLSGGIFSVNVKRKPKMLIIPTGSELVDWRSEKFQKSGFKELKPGQVLETNAYVLGKLAESFGGTYTRNDLLVDDQALIRQAVEEAVNDDFNIIIMVGGSSAGSEDYSKDVISDLGDVLVHGVTIMPGKPVIIGKVKDKPVFGIPGYPVSAIVAFEQFVKPLILKLLGQSEISRPVVQVEPARKIPSKLGVEEFLRVKLGKVDDRIVAIPMPRGAGCITTITEADGIIRIPNHVEGLNENQPVTAELLRPLSSIHNTMIMVGSHDNTIDVLADQIRAKQPGITLSSSHVGSLGGLMAIKRGMCHLVGSHLLDTDDGSYNISYIKKYLPEIPVKLVHLVLRDQGLIVRSGNPQHINRIEDLIRDDIAFINRQAGSGTRILLDHKLKTLGIDPSSIQGYENEEFTHMSVAVAVLNVSVDVGLGIYAAAKALGLDFIPVVTEQYDLVIPDKYFDSDNIQILLETINTQEFKKRVEALGGYNTDRTGEI